MSKVAIKSKCYWFNRRGKIKQGCSLMTELLCEKCGKCSFYETTEEYEKRQADFKERYDVSDDIFIV